MFRLFMQDRSEIVRPLPPQPSLKYFLQICLVRLHKTCQRISGKLISQRNADNTRDLADGRIFWAGGILFRFVEIFQFFRKSGNC
jgi:hypothetical protein